MNWGKLAALIRAHPARMLALSLLLLVPPAVASVNAKLSFNELAALPASSDSVKGYDALTGHFERGEISPVIVVLQRDESMWSDRSFRAINDLTVALGKLPNVALVRSLTQPTGGVFTEEQLREAGFGDLTKFPDRLQEGADGVGLVIGGLGRIRDGLVQMKTRLPELAGGLSDGADGARQMADSLAELRAGLREMRAGLARAADGLSSGAGEDVASGYSGVCNARNDDDLADAAESAQCHLHSALSAMHVGSTRSPQPQYVLVYEDVATAYGALTGVDDTTGQPATGDDPAETKAIADYHRAGGLEGMLRTISGGLREAVAGLDRIDRELPRALSGLADLGEGLDQGAGGVRLTLDGVAQMTAGLDQILPGLQRLQVGLAEGAARVRQSGFGDAATVGNLGLTPGLVEAIPGLRKQLGFFITQDEKTVRLYVTLEKEPYASESLAAVQAIRAAGAIALNKTELAGTPVLVAGPAAFFDDIRVLSNADFRVIMIAVLLGIFLVLALLLRSLVAPVYLILTVLVSFLATIGLTYLVFQLGFGRLGIPWWLPPFLFVMLVALGADYNIFLMSRIREEAKSHTTADATARGLALTGHVITSAGLILAGTFAALIAAPLDGLRQFGFAVTVGILLDTFVVRSLLVPSIATLLGRHNWWPSRRAAAP